MNTPNEDAISQLKAAVNVWISATKPLKEQTRTMYPTASPRDFVEKFWIGPECQFLKAVRAGLRTDDDSQYQSIQLSLDELCKEFEPDLSSLDGEFDTAAKFDPIGVFRREDWDTQLQQHQKNYWNNLPTNQKEQRQLIGDKLFSVSLSYLVTSLTPRFSLLAAAMAFAARASLQLRAWDAANTELSPAFVSDSIAAMRCINAVWPMLTGPPEKDQIKSIRQDQDQQHKATIAMRRLCLENSHRLPTSTWLTLLHLLRWLLGEQTQSVGSPGTVQLQMVDKAANQGRSIPLILEAVCETQRGCFVDLVQTGLIIPDSEMLESLNIAWEIAEHRMNDRSTRQNQVWALRMTMETGTRSSEPSDVRQIGGDSAGGMAALGLFAVADGNVPDARVTGSMSIRRKDNSRRINRLDDIVISGVAAATLPRKIIAAASASCRHFLVAADQSNAVLQHAHSAEIRLHPLLADGFHTGLKVLTTNARLAEILEPSNEAIIAAWNSVEGDGISWTAAGSGKAEWLRKPQPYIEPHLGKLLPAHFLTDSEEDSTTARQKQISIDRSSKYEWLTKDEKTRSELTADNQSAVAEAEFLTMFQQSALSRRIGIAEDANAGKSVLSRRLSAFLAGPKAIAELFNGQPPLILRWENGPREQSNPWPEVENEEQLLSLLSNALRNVPKSSAVNEEINGMIDDLLEQGRVALVLDSLDQASENSRGILSVLESSPKFTKVLVVVTGRSFSFSEQTVSSLFDRNRWGMYTILRFTKNQQTRFLQAEARRWNSQEQQIQSEPGPLLEGQKIDELFADYTAIEELLGVAGMLAMVRQIAVLQQKSESIAAGISVLSVRRAIRITRLKTRCDFYLEFFHRQMLSAAGKNSELNVDRNCERWQMMLAVTAFRMVLERATNYTVSGDARRQVKTDVEEYCRALVPKRELTEEDWETLHEFSVLSDHSMLEGMHGRVLSFRHKGWMEFFAGLFLARYSDPPALSQFNFDQLRPMVKPEEKHSPGFQGIETADYENTANSSEQCFEDVLLQLTNDPQWYWMWRFAIEMPRYQPEGSSVPKGPQNNVGLARSLGLLYLQPAREIRANELAWRAWYLFEQDRRTDLELRDFATLIPKRDRVRVLTRFRESSQALVREMTLLNDKWDKAPLKGTEQYNEWLNAWRQESSQNKSRTFLQCPPASWLAADPNANVSVMGSDTNHADEMPQHRVKVQPYRILSTPVEQGIYGIFDKRFAASRMQAAWGGVINEMITEYASPQKGSDVADHDQSCYPLIMPDWHDAFMFCKWLGPDFCLPSECQHEFAIRGSSEGDYCFGDDLDGTSLSEYAWWQGNSGNHAHAVGLKRPNAYGLFDVHGQVWEWSHDWFNDSWYEQRAKTADQQGICGEDSGPASGVSRCLRGSSFDDIDFREYARSSFRDHYAPVGRNVHRGFRVVWLCNSPQSSSGPSE